MNEEFAPQSIINNEYDYSNILPTVDAVSYLIQYCDNIYKQFTKKMSDDEGKNKQFKEEYKEYMYKKVYSNEFTVSIYKRSLGYVKCNDYENYLSAVKDGSLNKVEHLQIVLCLDFGRGKSDKIEKHENEFKIDFKPYEISFTRKSNHNDPTMNNIEAKINEILKQFPVANSIFYSK